ncbi:MAG: Gfo/Idh/MocA family oxidoreductase [Planctomycetaceae bacterium]|nr:Gfo/Idh/MocA family oxidoreductase [Planctomycetaceae bacterium]
MPSSTSVSRRQFLKTSVAASSVFAAPWIVPSTCFGANDRVVVGSIGVRNQGSGNLKRFQTAGCQIGAICDVDTDVQAEALKLVNSGTPKLYGDYRRLLEQQDLDAIVITTPDHWHALMTIHACEAGKDVYCEKPLSLTIAEGRRMVQAARMHERVVQTGSQQRSSHLFRKACELVRNGHIGDLHEVHCGISGVNHPGQLGPNTDPPANLDYNMWLGPAPERSYNEKRVHYNFRFWWDYSGGQMTNWGAHYLDIAQWGMGTDDTGPIVVEGTATFHPEGFHEVTETCRVTYTYANGVKVIAGQKQEDIPGGTTFIGSQGRVFVNRKELVTDPVDIAELSLDDAPIKLTSSDDHTQNFLDAIRSREKPICDVEIGHRSATVCHLGNIVCRLGRSIQWDPEAERIVDDEQAHAMTDRVYRAPWTHDLTVKSSWS